MLYINENKTVYMSEEDVKNFFDENIYYDQKYNQIITTSDTKVANIAVDEKQMTLNSSNVNMLDAIIKIKLRTYQMDNKWFFSGHQDLKIGSSLYLYTNQTNLYNLDIQNVEEIN